jgi:hypothetical protein
VIGRLFIRGGSGRGKKWRPQRRTDGRGNHHRETRGLKNRAGTLGVERHTGHWRVGYGMSV